MYTTTNQMTLEKITITTAKIFLGDQLLTFHWNLSKQNKPWRGEFKVPGKTITFSFINQNKSFTFVFTKPHFCLLVSDTHAEGTTSESTRSLLNRSEYPRVFAEHGKSILSAEYLPVLGPCFAVFLVELYVSLHESARTDAIRAMCCGKTERKEKMK